MDEDNHASRLARVQAAHELDPPREPSAEERDAVVAALTAWHMTPRTDYPEPGSVAWVNRGTGVFGPEWVVIYQLEDSLWAVNHHYGRPSQAEALQPRQTIYTTTLERMAIVAQSIGTGSTFTYGVPAGGWW